MTWQRREKVLASVAGGLVALLAVWFLLFGGDSRTSAQLRDRLRDEVAAKQQRLAAAERDAKRLAQWQRSALPSDNVVARSRYQNWLRGLANRVGFRQLNIESKEVETRRDMFTRMSFSLHGHVALADLARFLYDFYSAGHLQQIRQMDIKPLENARELDVNLTVEALSLPGADRKDQLTKESGTGLRLASLDDYRDPITKRNLFAPYVAPPPSHAGTAAAKSDNQVDVAQYAFVTGFTEVDGVRQVWIQDRVAGKLWRLNEGESFQVGRLRGTVRKITATSNVVVEFDGHRRRLRDGENLRGGVELEE
jgi:hypothetical protein